MFNPQNDHRTGNQAHRFLLAMALAVGLLACEGDGDDGPSQDDDADDAGDGDGDGDGAAPAYLVVTRIFTPEGRSLFASAIPDLDHGEVDIGRAIEAGGFSRVTSFGGKIYVFDSESGIATRYAVGEDGSSIVLDTLADGQPARLSFTGIGVQSFDSTIVFVDDERAMYLDIGEDLVVEWNPSAMTITSSVDAGVIRNGLAPTSPRPSLLDNHVIFPLSWSDNTTFEFLPYASIAVVDLEAPSNRPTVIDDDRCYGVGNTVVDGGAVYAIGDNVSGLALTVTDEPLPPPCLLRWRPGETTFDGDYYVDLAARTGSEVVTRAAERGDGTMLTNIYVGEEDPRDLDPITLAGGEVWRFAIVELEGEQSTVVEDLPPTALSRFLWSVDGAYYAPQTDRLNNLTTLYELDASGRATPVLTSTGDLFEVTRIR